MTQRHNILLIGCLAGIGCSDSAQELVGSRPNILIAIADDQSFPFAGAYGCNWVHTPAFDRVASEGILLQIVIPPMPNRPPRVLVC